MSKHTPQKVRHHSDVSRISLESSIEQLSNKIGAIHKRRIAIEHQIINTTTGISNLRNFIKLNQLENQEKQLVTRLEQLKYSQSLLTPKRNIPYREQDEFDEWKVAENEMKALEAEKALSKIRQTRQSKENNKEMDR
ncbi:MAG: hypothetical protein F9K23_18725 [Bacteroidetes bacterium]|nr:MAG: hypothetical protein F9K23_18725 [Bacteroidota bacterium]